MRTIADLCAALDGLPLAIELAAARVRSLDLSTILDRTTDRLNLLSSADTSVPERQRTIEATIAWSYDLLDHDEQRVLERFAVFCSAVDLAAITTVCSVDDLDVDTHLDRLVAHALVSARPAAGGYRYELLWTVRELAWDRAVARRRAEAMATRS
jgi:predicted ATPase